MNERRLVRTSKLLSRVLRHAPESIGIELDPAGWVDVDWLLGALARSGHPVSPAELEEVVARNDKKRFALSDDGRRIRASQGHSVPVDLGYAPVAPPERLYHGTARTHVASILADGIRRRSRHHVHLSPDADTATRVGRRHGRPVVLTVLAGELHRRGHLFYRSANGVWLTDHVPPEAIDPPETPETPNTPETPKDARARRGRGRDR